MNHFNYSSVLHSATAFLIKYLEPEPLNRPGLSKEMPANFQVTLFSGTARLTAL